MGGGLGNVTVDGCNMPVLESSLCGAIFSYLDPKRQNRPCILTWGVGV